MRTFLFSLGLLFLSLSSFSQQVAKSLTYKGTFVGFYEYKPTDYNQKKNKKYPLIIFLHGIGERGNGTSELPNLTLQGIPKNLKEGKTMTFTVNGKTETFLVLSPQLPKWLGAWENKYVDAMLEYAKEDLRVDEKRIFLTGLSLGGGGVWTYVTTSTSNAKKFAAIAPICGTCAYDFKQLTPTVGKADIGVWGFANMDDNIVSAWCTVSAIDELAKSKSKKIKKTINQWGGHDAWTKAYDVTTSNNSPNLYQWFLSQSESDDDDDDDDDDNNSSNQVPVNAAPVAKAGNDFTITLPNSAALNNNGSYDNDGNIQGWRWSKVSGPSDAFIASSTSPNATVTNLVPGTYVFRLTVTDNKNETSSDDVTVTVNAAPNTAPVAKAGNDVTITHPVSTVHLNNDGSFDSDGNIQGWNWAKISGPSDVFIASSNSPAAIANHLVPGTYVFRLTVTDNRNATATDDITVYVNQAANVFPVAKAGNDITITLPTNSVALNNDGSFDNDGDIQGWRWTRISGPSDAFIASATSPNATANNLVAGTYVFRLSVTDNKNATGTDEVTVTVNSAANVAPVAKAGNDVSTTLPANTVSLNNAGSFDSDGSINGWYWSKISGPSQFNIVTAYNASTFINNLVEGTYVFRLTVTDNDGVTASDDITVTVSSAPTVSSKPPVANAGKDEKIPIGQSTVLRGEKSYAEAGSIRSYYWLKIAGPATYNMLTPHEENTWINTLVSGTYVFRLTVTDNKGITDSDEVTITVNGTLPVALAGKDESIPVGQSTVLHGENSYVLGGSIASYRWNKISGPANYEIMSPDEKTTWIRKMQPGVYIYRLTVRDYEGNFASDDVVITVGNSSIVADAGKDETIPMNQATVLVGDNSYVAGGSIKSYSWSKISGPGSYEMLTPNSQSTWIRNMVNGTYVYRLTVTDHNGATDFDDVVITVNGWRNGNGANDQPLTAAAEIDGSTISTSEKLNVYPNPVISMLNIRWSGIQKGNATLKIIDAGGKIVKSTNISKQQFDFNTSVEVASLMPGLYIIQIQFANGKPLNKQFLKR